MTRLTNDDSSDVDEISMKAVERVTSSDGLLNINPGRKPTSSYGFVGVRQDDNEERFDDNEPSGEDVQLLIDDAIGMPSCFSFYGMVAFATQSISPLSPFRLTERLGYGPFQNHILWAVGLCFASSSMEMLLFSFLAVVLQADWNLTEHETDAISSAVFVGGLLGNLVLGPLGDRIGRKPVFLLTATILCVFGLATAAAGNYFWLWLCRFAVGFGVGGLAVPFDALAEFMPMDQRGTNLLFVQYFWTVGTVLVPAIAYVCFQSDGSGGWRLFCALCAVPCLLTIFVGVFFVPESPRWLLLQGRHDEALGILRKAALQNGKSPQALFPMGLTLVHSDAEEEGGNFFELFSPKWLTTTLLLWGVWACQYFIYFGAIMAITLVFVKDPSTDGENGGQIFDYGPIFVSALAETVGTSVVILLIDRIGRVPSQAVSYLLGGTSVFALCAFAAQDNPPRISMMVAAFITRLSFMSGTCATWVSTAEIFVTEIRTSGHSTSNAVGSISGMISPYVVSSTTPFNTIGCVILFLSILTSFLVTNLPETRGKAMGSRRETRDDR